MIFGRRKVEPVASGAQPRSGLVYDSAPSRSQIKRATRSRLCWDLFAALCLLITVIFLILVELGDTDTSRSGWYFVNINVTNVVPKSVPDSALINSIARTLGLHDFYTVGLWGYCEGYNGQGVTGCSTPQLMYWFNPVAIIQSQLLSGASIEIPQQLTDILSLVETVSHVMFALFLTGACLSFVLIFLVPLSVYTRWATFPIAVLSFLNALFITVASVIATAGFVIMANVFNTKATQLNITASIGTTMFAFMWIASAFAILAWLIQTGQLCCCASRRDVRTGRKTGALNNEALVYDEKPTRRQHLGWQ